MSYSERQSEILEHLTREKSMSVHRLARLLSISESSVRRDLTALEETGKIRRTFGGAVLSEAPEREVSLRYRTTQHMAAKAEIARRAAVHLHDGMVIFLDASSSAAQMVNQIEHFKDITVITNSPLTSVALGERGIRNYCTGGLLLNSSLAYVGSGAARFAEGITADAVFFSCRGYSEDGILSDSLEEENSIRQVMLLHSRRRIFLCDRSKYGLSFPYRLCRASELDAVITEDE